jgi:hypothetical protein
LLSVTVTPSDSNYFNRSASLKRVSSIIFTTKESVGRIRNIKSNASQNDAEEDFSWKTPRARFLMEKNAPQARLIKQNALQAEFLN